MLNRHFQQDEGPRTFRIFREDLLTALHSTAQSKHYSPGKLQMTQYLPPAALLMSETLADSFLPRKTNVCSWIDNENYVFVRLLYKLCTGNLCNSYLICCYFSFVMFVFHILSTSIELWTTARYST